MENGRTEKSLVKLVRSVREIDILYSKDESRPFLFSHRLYFGIGITLFSAGLPYFIDEYSDGKLYSMFNGLVFTAFILFNFVVLSFLFYYFESRPIIKRMKEQEFDVTGLRFQPLNSCSLFESRLSEIDARCIEHGFFSGGYDDIERIQLYIKSLKDLLLSAQSRDSRRILGSSQLITAFFLLAGGLVTYLLQPQPAEPLTMQGLVVRIAISLIIFLAILLCLMLGESVFKLYSLVNNREEVQLQDACYILTHIRLTLIRYYVGRKSSGNSAGRTSTNRGKRVVSESKKKSQKPERGVKGKSKIKTNVPKEQSDDGEVRVSFV